MSIKSNPYGIDAKPTERRIDPDVASAARHADMPDGLVYDTFGTERGGTGSIAISIFIAGAAALLLAFMFSIFI